MHDDKCEYLYKGILYRGSILNGGDSGTGKYGNYDAVWMGGELICDKWKMLFVIIISKLLVLIY